jgi:hypothetical protein
VPRSTQQSNGADICGYSPLIPDFSFALNVAWIIYNPAPHSRGPKLDLTNQLLATVKFTAIFPQSFRTSNRTWFLLQPSEFTIHYNLAARRHASGSVLSSNYKQGKVQIFGNSQYALSKYSTCHQDLQQERPDVGIFNWYINLSIPI